MPDRDPRNPDSPAPDVSERARPGTSPEERPAAPAGRSDRRGRQRRPRSSGARPPEGAGGPPPASGGPSDPASKSERPAEPVQPRSGRRRRSRGDRSRDNRPNTRAAPPPQPAGERAPDGDRRNRPPRNRPSSQTPVEPGPTAPGQRQADGARDGGRNPRRRDQNRSNPREDRAVQSPGQPGLQRRPNRAGGDPRRLPQQPGASKTGRGSRAAYRPTGPFPPPSNPIKARGGIKARSEGEDFGKNWWAKRWLVAMERLMDGARLQRGRRYARMGQILSMNESGGGIVARVQGSRPQPYKVAIRISPFSDEQWDTILDVLAGQAIFTAQLLAGEMPANIEDAFAAAGVSLFPARGGDLMTECSCPDWANPCKHIAATHYILGDRFDEDPFLIFRLRGRSQEQILQALRQRRSGQPEPEAEEILPQEEPVAPLDERLAHFWEIGAPMENFSVNIQAPSIPLPVLKRLGDPDAAGRISIEDNLGAAYEAMSQFALMLAFSDINRENGENGQE